MGSVAPPDILLTQAFVEQTAQGWDQFLRGRVSSKWGQAFNYLNTDRKQRADDATQWTKNIILKLWEYSISLWKFRNGIVHGTTAKEQAEKRLASLRAQVTEEYQLYEADPFIVSPQYNSLFLKKTLQDRLKMSQDSLSSWLRSVKEAKQFQCVFRASLQKTAKRFFLPRSQYLQCSSNNGVVPPVETVSTTANTAACNITLHHALASPQIREADFDPG